MQPFLKYRDVFNQIKLYEEMVLTLLSFRPSIGMLQQTCGSLCGRGHTGLTWL